MLGHFAPGITLPLHPFFGSVGVAPPASMGRLNSAPPSIHAGNLDNKELVAGTTLYIPVWTKGALLELGDGHAGQGNGEVDITAMETSLTSRLQVVVRKDMHLTWPRGETPTHYIAMGTDSSVGQSDENSRPTGYRAAGPGERNVARRCLSTHQRFERCRHHPARRWDGWRTRNDPEGHLCRPPLKAVGNPFRRQLPPIQLGNSFRCELFCRSGP